MTSKYPKLLLALAGLMAGLANTGVAAEYYWDTNGTTAGFGVGGTWGTDAFWTTATNGTTATVAWPGNNRAGAGPDNARFNAGSGTVAISGTQTAALVRVAGGGTYTLSGGTLNLETSNFGTGIQASASDSDNGNSFTIDSAITLGADAGSGGREVIFSAGRTAGTDGTNTLTLNGSISAGSGARAASQLIQLRPQTASANSSTTITQSATSVISNGTQTVSVEFGTRVAAANSGRVEVMGSNTYTGSTRIASGTVVVYTDVANNTAGAFGNNANAIDIGFGQVSSTSHVRLLTNGARTISKAINVGNGGTLTSDYAVTLGGETAGTSTFSGNIDLDGSVARTTKVSLTAASGGTVNFTGVLSHGTSGSAVPIEKTGAGTVILSNTNTYTGGTTVSAGTLSLGANGGLPASGAVTLAGGTLATNSFTSASLGTLTLTGNSIIDLTGGGSFIFADSSAASWASNTLTISGTFISGSALKFGTSTGGLTSGQLSQISAAGWSNFALNGSGFLTASAIPEPSSYALLASFGAFGYAALRRRRRAA